MPQSVSSSAATLLPAEAGKDRRSCAQDILWGRPIFRAPDLPSPRVIFEPLPFRTQSFASAHYAAGR